MIEFLSLVVAVALLAAFALLLLGKLRVLEFLQARGGRLLSAMARCGFCLSWWTSVAVSLSAFAATSDARFLAVPFFSTPLTRIMI